MKVKDWLLSKAELSIGVSATIWKWSVGWRKTKQTGWKCLEGLRKRAQRSGRWLRRRCGDTWLKKKKKGNKREIWQKKKREQRRREWETVLPFMDRLGAYPSCLFPANQFFRSIELGLQNTTHLFLCLVNWLKEKLSLTKWKGILSNYEPVFFFFNMSYN